MKKPYLGMADFHLGKSWNKNRKVYIGFIYPLLNFLKNLRLSWNDFNLSWNGIVHLGTVGLWKIYAYFYLPIFGKKQGERIGTETFKGILEELYWKMKPPLSIATIANLLGHSTFTISRWLEQYKIPKRPPVKIIHRGVVVSEREEERTQHEVDKEIVEVKYYYPEVEGAHIFGIVYGDGSIHTTNGRPDYIRIAGSLKKWEGFPTEVMKRMEALAKK